MKTNENPVYILGIESSGLTSAISISRDGQVLAQTSLNIKNIHSRLLAQMTERILAYTNVKAEDISALALSAGPGSFTGLRIGYSLAKGLAHGLNIPIVQVPTLNLWAYQHGEVEMPVLALIDAHRNEIFCALYRWHEGRMIQTGDYRLLPLNSLPEILDKPTVIVGGGALKLKEELRKVCGEDLIFPKPFRISPQSWALHDLAYQKFLDKEISPADACEPQYMRAFKGIM